MDEIRRRIAQRLDEMGKSQSWLSQQLGRNRGYVHEYLDGSPNDLPYETKVQVAKLLNISLRELGIAPIEPAPPPGGGMAEDGEPFEPPSNHYLARAPHIAYFRVRTNVLDQHVERIMPSSVLAFDLNLVSPSEIPSGKVVVVQCYDKRDLTKSHGTIFRQFVAPNKLITNSSGANEMMSLDDATLPFEPVIKGTLIAVIGEVN